MGILIFEMYTVPTWPSRPIWTEETISILLEDIGKDEQHEVSLQEIKRKSEEFPIKFPIDSVRCKVLESTISTHILERNINSAYPVLHEKPLQLFFDFLNYKRKFGTETERQLYKCMSVLQFVDRLLTKRAVVFVDVDDQYLLIDGTVGFGQWEKVGKNDETEKLKLQNCLSYDEIKLSAFLSVSSYTNFINDGDRFNNGVTERNNVEAEGIIIGLIGARFEKPQVMEYQEIIISKKQNNEANGYGAQCVPTMQSIISGFYGEVSFVYRQALEFNKTQSNRFLEIGEGTLFDNDIYCKRVTLSIETLLFEAQQRAKDKNTTAFVHLVGLGLGVWKISPHQNSLFIETVIKRIETMGENLNKVSDVVFAHFGNVTAVGSYTNGGIIPIPSHPEGGIRVHLSKRRPHLKLTDKDEGKLLVVSYAWDGNALPGNEFWHGYLSASGDPATASSTQVAELHNPHISAKVLAKNLRIAGPFGVIPFTQYRTVALVN
ncbi:hypothetical protein FQA39_LY10497 [Lamprigera yunnana]|nr:hypothetical protein FQA39_LY10497 [Lamprigera yunnana]